MSIRTFRATGAGVINETFSPNTAFQIIGIYLHLDIAGATAEDLTVDLDAVDGVAYDLNILTEDMNTVKDVIRAALPIYGDLGDTLKIAYPNTDTRTWGLTIKVVEAN